MRSLLVGVVVIGAAVLPSPSELLTSSAVPDGYELAGPAATDLDFDTFAVESPYSVGHVESGSDEADATTAAQDVWALGDGDVLLRELATWPTADVAAGFVAEIADYATEIGIDEATAPFEGARAFSGPDDENGVWVRMVVWQDGRIGALVNHFSVDAGDDPGSGDVDAAANSLASRLAAANRAADPQDPLADGGGGSSTSSGGGIPITTVLLWLAIIVGAIWVFVKLRKKLRAARGASPAPAERGTADTATDADDDERSVDEMIERARARRRAEREVDAIPDPTEEWTPPDEY